MRILYLDPVGHASFVGSIADGLAQVSRHKTQIDVISLQPDRPHHLEYHAYEALVIADLVRITYALNKDYDAIVIGCFYDVGLREVREVSGKAIVTAPCQSTTAIASQLGNTFSVLVGRRKWIPKMRENVRLYGHEHAMASMRPLEIGVLEFQQDHDYTCERMMTEGRKAVEQDGAEVIILGCTAEFGFHETLQDELGVPVIDAILAPFKFAEMLGETAQQFGWHPSRKWGSEAPPQDEIEAWGLFRDDLPEIKTLVSAKPQREIVTS